MNELHVEAGNKLNGSLVREGLVDEMLVYLAPTLLGPGLGMANNRNPIAVFIPCHRVIGADGSMVGYGGGLDIKKHLLRLEGCL